MSEPKTCYHCGREFDLEYYILHLQRVMTRLGGGRSETLKYLLEEAEKERDAAFTEGS